MRSEECILLFVATEQIRGMGAADVITEARSVLEQRAPFNQFAGVATFFSASEIGDHFHG